MPRMSRVIELPAKQAKKRVRGKGKAANVVPIAPADPVAPDHHRHGLSLSYATERMDRDRVQQQVPFTLSVFLRQLPCGIVGSTAQRDRQRLAPRTLAPADGRCFAPRLEDEIPQLTGVFRDDCFGARCLLASAVGGAERHGDQRRTKALGGGKAKRGEVNAIRSKGSQSELLRSTSPAPTASSAMNFKPVDDREDDGIKASCANCGKHGSDIIKLKNCTACRLVKYCSADCQRAHRKLHKKACKQRAAELKDEQLFSQGHERPEGDFCSICTLPIPIPTEDHAGIRACCMKMICNGCDLAAKKRGMNDCPFCRTNYDPENYAVCLALIQTRVAKKDPTAIHCLGQKYFFGNLGLQKDVRKAVELYTEAAELGSVEALFSLGNLYFRGDGVRGDKAKAAEFYTKAAMQGHAGGRHNIGNHEGTRGNYHRAEVFKAGLATKEQYAEALKGYQDAIEEMKCHGRDEAKAYLDNGMFITPGHISPESA
ncbi:hypothetical protein THAOC_20378 [Thalassiosira oceanica]|uniref:MYND-type domain-containing protein n=1 Tax=Thalassiosira oceanica TaxID=159749 RepID=K0SEN0_THAOC|nr:hypothetical protein THAOC_20378 [Thalassiosira oceanica]|eukprot:EJK59406.1 hypothetical protein THAOC_20378 [Thalassiosira oceanica]